MTNQYINNRNLHLGAVDVRVALYSDRTKTYDTAESIGMLDGSSFKVSGEPVIIETDNADDEFVGISKPQAECTASAWKNLDLSMLYLLTGQAGTLTTTDAGTINVTDEEFRFNGTVMARLAHRQLSDTPTEVENIVVKNIAGDVTYTLGDDYVKFVDAAGYTNLARVSSGRITEAQDVRVSYDYTGVSAKQFNYNSAVIPQDLQVWITNVNAAGKKFQIKMHKVHAIKGLELAFGSDKSKTLMSMPISIIGVPDSSISAEDYGDIFYIVDEQGGVREI